MKQSIKRKPVYQLLAAWAAGVIFSFTACSDDDSDAFYVDNNTYYDEAYRPMIHFTPQKFWMNDPNGMVYLDGEYHLFYQHNTQASKWGPMNWGHAVSTDLMHWEHLPVALSPDKNGGIFSGSAVIDKDNTAGFGAGAMVAIYTSNGDRQRQSLAYSTDKGRTFTMYENNPVLKDDSKPDFRDPKVFRYDAGNCWIMSLATGQSITFYSSPDLKNWTKESEFGEGIGAHGGVWECPDLFPLDYNGGQKWVLLVSINPGGPNGGSATQYFTGSFDGKTFTPDPSPYPLWLDYGKDNYAGVTWNNVPEADGRRLFIGWMSNWQYAEAVPTMSWRSGATLPRELSLTSHTEGYPLLTSRVAKEIETIAGSWSEVTKNNNTYELIQEPTPYQVELTLDLPADGNCTFSLENEAGEAYQVTVDTREGRLITDRTKSGKVDFSPEFGKVMAAPLNARPGKFRVTLFVDHASVETLVNEGESQQTNLVFPQSIYTRLVVKKGSSVQPSAVKVRALQPVWQ